MYRLFSHPLPKSNYTNQTYVQRGYLGATMIVLYMLITTIVSVRTVPAMRKTGGWVEWVIGWVGGWVDLLWSETCSSVRGHTIVVITNHRHHCHH